MILFDELVSKFEALEESQQTIAQVAKEIGFNNVPLNNKKDSFAGDGNYYEVYRAEYNVGNEKIIAVVKTKDKYRSFGKDDEPFTSTVELWSNCKIINEKSYTFWK